jgi:hypothetical protein
VTLIHASHDQYLYRDYIAQAVDEYVPVRREDVGRVVGDVSIQKPNARYYIAGSLSFVAAVRDILQKHGIHKIEVDEFKGFED